MEKREKTRKKHNIVRQTYIEEKYRKLILRASKSGFVIIKLTRNKNVNICSREKMLEYTLFITLTQTPHKMEISRIKRMHLLEGVSLHVS